MIPYILYAALILTASLIFYKLLLQKETFFHLNRMILLGCMLLAFLLPLIKIPQQLSFRKAPAVTAFTVPSSTTPNKVSGQVAQKLDKTIVGPLKANQAINIEQVIQWLIYLYWFGVLIFALNFLMQAALLLYKAYSRPV